MRRPISRAVLVLTLPFAGQTCYAQAVAFEPVVSAFPDGVGLSATPVVSLDRRYVRLGVDPTFTALQGFSTFSVPAAVSGGGVNGIGGVGGGVAGFAGLNGPINPGAGGLPIAPVSGLGDGAPPPAGFGFSSDPFEAALRAPRAPAPAPPAAPPRRRPVRKRPVRHAPSAVAPKHR